MCLKENAELGPDGSHSTFKSLNWGPGPQNIPRMSNTEGAM